MSLISDLDRKVEGVIASAIRHAQFTGTLKDDIVAIETAIDTKVKAAEAACLKAVETKLAEFEAGLSGGLKAVSQESAEALAQHVGQWPTAVAAPPSPAEPASDHRRIDPNTGLPAEG